MSVALNVDFVRAQFPPLKDGWVFLENAGGSYVPQQVIARAAEYMSDSQVQPNWEFASSVRATERIKAGLGACAEFINAEPDEVFLGPSTTMNVFMMSQALAPWWQPGDEVIVTEQDHEANVGAWRRLERKGLVIREWRVDRTTGALVEGGLDDLLGPRTKLVAMTHCSNVCSIVHDLPKLVKQIHAAGALAFIDGTAYAPHFPIDVKALDVDFYVFSLYKVCGPHQSVMFGKRPLLERAEAQNHFFIGNESISYKFLPGGPNHELAAATVGTADYFDGLYRAHFDRPENAFHTRLAKVYQLIGAHEARLAGRVEQFLRGKQSVRILGRVPTADGRLAPVVGFWVPGRSSTEIAARLQNRKIAIGNGDFWARRCITALGLTPEDGVVRVGIAHYNSDSDIDRLLEALDEALR
ncbi:MAG TPA: aminotransferase class V-fold PLP-dependent enzyme [Candidatus Binatia bacterium]|nr:aminotransferase class V-fold PLP-dependent enzyme [Candidatus Binatia bacterium]